MVSSIMSRKLAFSYTRFSSGEQARGDSMRRQVAQSESYCREHNLALDEALTDAGVSAFRGDHAKRGAFAAFLKAVESGKVPRGSVLLVESLDRLSRQKPLQALRQLLSIIESGVEVVTLIDRQRYSAAEIDRNPYGLMLSIGIMARAHEESATKSSRLSAAWERKRQNIADGKPVRQVLPAWLAYDETGRVVPVADRVKLIRRMFALTLRGWGKMRIANILDAEGVEPWGVGRKKSAGGWQVSYIQRIITARTLIGEFQPHKMANGRRSQRIPAGPPIPNYYPAVIDVKIFNAAQALRRPDAKGRADHVKNLFTGLCYDGTTGAILHIEHHGRRGGKNNGKKSYLTTARVLRKKHGCISWRYDLFERAFLDFLRDLRLEKVLATAERDEGRVDALRLILAEKKQAADDVKKQISRLVDALAAGESAAIVSRIQALETENAEALAAVQTAQQALAAEETRQATLTETASGLRAALRQCISEPEVRRRLRDEIRKVVEKINLFPRGDVPGSIAEKSDFPAFRILFRSGVTRTIFMRNPKPRCDDVPQIIAIEGDGYTEQEWRGVLAAVRMPNEQMPA